MATTTVSHAVARGGSFLVESPRPDDIFTPADINDEQKLIAQTTEEFVDNEVVPLIPELEQHKPGVMAPLLKKAGALGLLGGAIPEEYGGAGLDKVSATLLAEKLSTYGGFSVTHGAHSG
ncbi:MAG: acyl-CoA dehydrogenase family protein, partial [Terriglobales bacterium]